MTDTQIAAAAKFGEAFGLLEGCLSGLVWCNEVQAMRKADETQKKADELFRQGVALLGGDYEATRTPMEAGYMPSRAHVEAGDCE